MSGRFGPNGIGWCWGFDRRDYIMIAVDLIDEDFDISEALREAQAIRDLPDEPLPEIETPRERRSRERSCAVYRFYDETGRLLYVGKALNPAARQKQHEKRVWWSDVDQSLTGITWYPSERAALDAEDQAIRDENPVYNRVGGGRR